MPTYLVHRTVGSPSEDDVRAMVERDRELREQAPEVRWVRSYYSAEEGKLYCEYEAPSLQLLTAHLARVGIPLDRATVVENLEPSMFW
jgi:hypothetical protein